MDIFHENFAFCFGRGFRETATTVSTPHAVHIYVGCSLKKNKTKQWFDLSKTGLRLGLLWWLKRCTCPLLASELCGRGCSCCRAH